MEQAVLTSDLHRMLRPPFGLGEDGRPIDDGDGKLVVGAINWMQEVVAERAEQEAKELPEAERAARVEEARSAAFDRLVDMLNGAIEDSRCHVTREYLLSESNQYSYEFRLFVAEYCRVISGDPTFFFHQGTRSIPTALAYLVRPLGLQGTYAVLPRLVAKFVQTDLRVVRTTPASATRRTFSIARASPRRTASSKPFTPFASVRAMMSSTYPVPLVHSSGCGLRSRSQ